LTVTSAEPIIHAVRLQVLVEVSGCPTTCMHCWALGGSYGSMPLEDAAFALDELASFCGDGELSYTAYPMHEVTAHPEAPDVIRLFAQHLGEPYDPILTPGTPLASRDDWEEIILAAKECGAKALWVAFHGFGEEHDRQLNRPGAFEETCVAVRRAQDCGLGTGANVFLTKPNLRDFARLHAVLFALQLGEMSIAPAAYRRRLGAGATRRSAPSSTTSSRWHNAYSRARSSTERHGAISLHTRRPHGFAVPSTGTGRRPALSSSRFISSSAGRTSISIQARPASIAGGTAT
jgi:hypothetical protein